MLRPMRPEGGFLGSGGLGAAGKQPVPARALRRWQRALSFHAGETVTWAGASPTSDCGVPPGGWVFGPLNVVGRL
jgi:hypothetical protein